MLKWSVVVLAAAAVVFSSRALYAIHPEQEVPVVPYEVMLKHKPVASAGDLRYHVTVHMPYTAWEKWPGKGEMYPGREPHGALLTTYVNEQALNSIKKAKGSMANGSIIVKENYDSGKKLVAVTVMYKVNDYNPGAGNWFWAKYDPKFNILAEGKIEGCIKCHGEAKDNDYIMTGKMTGK